MNQRETVQGSVIREAVQVLVHMVTQSGGDLDVLIGDDAALFAQLPRRVAFSDYKRWSGRLGSACPPGTSPEQLARLALSSPHYQGLLRALSLVVEPRWVYTVGYAYGASKITDVLEIEVEELPDGRVRVRQELVAPYSLDPLFWRVSAACIQLLPTTVGFEAADMEVRDCEGRLDLVLAPPVSTSLLGRVSRGLRAFFRGSAALAELSEQEQRLNRQNRELQATVRELEEARERAETALRAKQRFLAVMSHELRTPLHGMLGTVQLLHDPQMEDHREELEQVMQRSTEHLLGMVENILDFTDLEGIESQRVPLESRAFAQELDRSFAWRARERGLDWSVDHGGLPARVLVDEEALWRGLRLLLDNALKFTERGGVQVRLVLVDDRLVASVQDSGPGIAPEDQAGVFELFTQLDQSATRRHGGVGLGLALAREHLEAVGGSLTLESTPGQGCLFSLALPACRAERPEPQQVRSGAPRVLVAEDNPVNQLVLRRMLGSLGVQADFVADGRAVLEHLEQRDYGLVLMDCEMPSMDGFEATRALRARGHALPVVAATAYTGAADRARCERAGMDGFLAKPFGRERLAAELQRWLSLAQEPGPPLEP